MNIRCCTSIILLLISILFPLAADAVSVSAFVDQTDVTLEDSIHLSISVKDGDGHPDVSVIKDFKVQEIGPRSSIQIINGQMTKEVVFNYRLLPFKKGALSIPAIPVNINGKLLYTQAIRMMVSEGNTPDQGARDLFVSVLVSNESPFVGEQITYTFKLHQGVQIANGRFQQPDFTGFTAKELENRKSFRTQINDREYVVTELIFVLIPMSAGKFDLEPAVLQCDVADPKKKRRRSAFDSFFDDRFFSSSFMETKVFRSQPVTIHVKALPSYQGSVPFSGLVGKFEIEGRIEKRQMVVGDSTTLTVSIKGNGNIMDAKAPVFNFPVSFKTYDDAPEETIQLTRQGYSGEKVFRTALVGVKEGEFSLDPIEVAIFDVQESAYKTLVTDSLSLRVLPTEEKESLNVVSPSVDIEKTIKNKVKFTGKDILPLKEGLSAISSSRTLSAPWFLVILLFPGIVLCLFKGLIIMTQKKGDPSDVMLKRGLKNLKSAEKSNIQPEDFLSDLSKALSYTILSKKETPGESITFKEAKEILVSNGLPEETAEKAKALLESLESFRYSGISAEKAVMAGLLEKTKKMVRRLTQ